MAQSMGYQVGRRSAQTLHGTRNVWPALRIKFTWDICNSIVRVLVQQWVVLLDPHLPSRGSAVPKATLDQAQCNCIELGDRLECQPRFQHESVLDATRATMILPDSRYRLLRSAPRQDL